MFPFRRPKPETDLVLVTLRFGVGSVFLWFGLDRLIHVADWSGLVPDWPWLLFLVPPAVLVMVSGVFEFLLGAGLLDGRYGRLLPGLASVWIIAGTFLRGVDGTTVRESGILGACLVLLVMADRKAKNPWPKVVTRNLGYAYVIFLLAIGIMFLRQPVGI
ncbi:hypothetical protein JW899_01605 [Candidatus Uhrbacteria bacterium]|nr:hypothetical protein [Candidatus Uhrbacteria bacterium]